LALRLSGEEREQLTKRYTDDPEAYQLYLQGHYLWARGGRENVRKSFEYYERAIDKDPKFALAYAGMAESHLRSTVVGPGSVPAREGVPKAKAAVTKALELDDTLAEAHNALAEIKYQFDYDWPGAEKEFKRAVELNPNAAFIRLGYGFYLMSAGRFDEALAELERAQELDPSSLTINRVRGRLFYFMRQYDRAVEHFQKIVEVEPNARGVHFHLALTYEQKGMYGEAVAEHLKDASIGGYLKPEEIEAFRETFRVSGWRGYIQKWIDGERREGGSKFPVLLAAHYTRLDEREQAFAWLEKAFDERDANLVHLKIEPGFDRLRGDPRFQDLLRRVGLKP
jgi:tetratricopeptide (TPR) repeat protein